MSAAVRPQHGMSTANPALSIRYAPARVLAHFAAAAAFFAAVAAIVVSSTEVDLAAGAVFAGLVLALDGYGTLRRVARREPIVTLAPDALILHLPGAGAFPWADLRGARLTGNLVTGRAIEAEYRGARPDFGVAERLGWGVSARERKGIVRLSIGCLEQSDRGWAEIEAVLRARAAPQPEEKKETAT